MKVVKTKLKKQAKLTKKKPNKKLEKTIATLKEVLLTVKQFIFKNRKIFYMSFSFIAMDLMTRFLGRSINFYKIYRFVPNFFTIIWTFNAIF